MPPHYYIKQSNIVATIGEVFLSQELQWNSSHWGMKLWPFIVEE